GMLIRLRHWRRLALRLEHECAQCQESEQLAKSEVTSQAEHARQLQEQLSEARLELARVQATASERERAFRLMKEELDDSRERLKADFQNLAAQVLQEREQQFRSSSQDAMTILLQPFREQLQAFQQRVNQVHDESLRGHTTLASEVRRLSEVGLQMSREAETLATALKGDKKITGNWGEVRLERSLQLAGLERGVHYDTQVRIKDVHGDMRLPDFIIKLPDDKHIVLDSKVSLVDYDRAVSAESDEARQAALDAHVRAV